MHDDWWYANESDRHGPLSTAQIRELIHQGAIGPSTLVWRPGRLAWKPVFEVAEFASEDIAARVPPALAQRDQRSEPVFDLVPLREANVEPRLEEEAYPSWARTVPAPTAVRPYEPSVDLAGPWRRFMAQLFDIWTLSLPTGYLLGLIGGHLWPSFGLWLSSPTTGASVGLLIVPLALFAQALVFGLFGTTLGKLLLGIQVSLLDGSRPTFIEYLGRMLRLHWAGFGLGLPFVTLFTMWRQYARVKAGKPASYDTARFQVHAIRMSGMRRSLAAVSVVALLVGIGYLQRLDWDEKRQYLAGFDWHNPISDKHVDIPRGWVFTQQMNSDGDPVFTFSSHAAGVVTVFAMEEGDEALTLEQYQRMWVMAVRREMVMDIRATPIHVKGRSGLQMRGVMANNASRLVHTTLVKNGDQIWRIVTVGTSGKEPESAATEQLRVALLESLAERPLLPEPPAQGAGGRGTSI